MYKLYPYLVYAIGIWLDKYTHVRVSVYVSASFMEYMQYVHAYIDIYKCVPVCMYVQA